MLTFLMVAYHIGFDPTQDTPLELLHVILLGIVRYAWFMSTKTMTPEQLASLEVDLESVSIHGLSIPPLRPHYLIQYKASLIGKQYKQIAQTAIFHIHKYVDKAHFALWKSLAPLCALLWYTEITDMKRYEVCHYTPATHLYSAHTF
jgi:hypothetical protein